MSLRFQHLRKPYRIRTLVWEDSGSARIRAWRISRQRNLVSYVLFRPRSRFPPSIASLECPALRLVRHPVLHPVRHLHELRRNLRLCFHPCIALRRIRTCLLCFPLQSKDCWPIGTLSLSLRLTVCMCTTTHNKTCWRIPSAASMIRVPSLWGLATRADSWWRLYALEPLLSSVHLIW